LWLKIPKKLSWSAQVSLVFKQSFCLYIYGRMCSFTWIHLAVPSSLRWLTRNAGPQVTVDSSSGAVTGWQARPLLDVPDPVVSGAPSWSSAFDFAFHWCSQKIVFALDVAKITEFSFLNIFQELPWCFELFKNFFICNTVFPFDITHLAHAPHFEHLNFALVGLGQCPGFAAVGEDGRYNT